MAGSVAGDRAGKQQVDVIPQLAQSLAAVAAQGEFLEAGELVDRLLDHIGGLAAAADDEDRLAAGGVIDGVARSVMGVTDPAPMVERLGDIARALLEESIAEKSSPVMVAERRAWTRIREAATVAGEI